MTPPRYSHAATFIAILILAAIAFGLAEIAVCVGHLVSTP